MAGKAFMNQLPEVYKQGTVLSVDIGAGTTGLALFFNGIFYERSAKTYKIGGNTAREFLIDDITKVWL
jgi:cell division ATPase FtsA